MSENEQPTKSAKKQSTVTEVEVDGYPEAEPRPYEDAKKKK